jgi:hypothetical protein
MGPDQLFGRRGGDFICSSDPGTTQVDKVRGHISHDRAFVDAEDDVTSIEGRLPKAFCD